MRTLLIDNGTVLLPQLQKLVGPDVVTKKWDTCTSNDSKNYDLIILSGSHDSSVLRDHSKFDKEIDLIKSSKAPIIGICFGCELIAYAFGGHLKEMDHKSEGTREIHFLKSELFSESDVSVYEGHRWVISEMPKDFIVLAKSEDGPEVIRHKTLPIYGLQFHPENSANGFAIIRSLLRLTK